MFSTVVWCLKYGSLYCYVVILQAMERDVKNLESVVRKLGVAVDELGGKGHSGRISPILTKQMELKQQYDMVVVATRNKLNDLQDMLKQVYENCVFNNNNRNNTNYNNNNNSKCLN